MQKKSKMIVKFGFKARKSFRDTGPQLPMAIVVKCENKSKVAKTKVFLHATAFRKVLPLKALYDFSMQIMMSDFNIYTFINLTSVFLNEKLL